MRRNEIDLFRSDKSLQTRIKTKKIDDFAPK